MKIDNLLEALDGRLTYLFNSSSLWIRMIFNLALVLFGKHVKLSICFTDFLFLRLT